MMHRRATATTLAALVLVLLGCENEDENDEVPDVPPVEAPAEEISPDES